jgi:S-methylmethionine-dependent homocysteine/selenocysteine methylase
MAIEILDGAIGTELLLRGVSLGAADWSARAVVDAPEVLAKVHADYARAGATLHTANTFRTQPRAFGQGWEKALESAVRIARGAIPDRCKVLGSMAPVEDCYRPDLSPGTAAGPEHRKVAEALARAGCDILLCETFANRAEAVTAAREAVATGLPTWLSLTAGPFGDLLTPAQLGAIAREAELEGIARLLVNCIAATKIQPYVEVIASLGLPIGVYANAGAEHEGLGWAASGREAANAYADLAEEWVAAGATVVGGCCGTGPAHIEALAERFA